MALVTLSGEMVCPFTVIKINPRTCKKYMQCTSSRLAWYSGNGKGHAILATSMCATFGSLTKESTSVTLIYWKSDRTLTSHKWMCCPRFGKFATYNRCRTRQGFCYQVKHSDIYKTILRILDREINNYENRHYTFHCIQVDTHIVYHTCCAHTL